MHNMIQYAHMFSTYFAGWLQCSLDQSGPDLVPLLGSNLPHHHRGHPAFLQPNTPTSRVTRFSTFFGASMGWAMTPASPTKTPLKTHLMPLQRPPCKSSNASKHVSCFSERSIFKQKQHIFQIFKCDRNSMFQLQELVSQTTASQQLHQAIWARDQNITRRLHRKNGRECLLSLMTQSGRFFSGGDLGFVKRCVR